jgi:NAD-dependent protein deacetylase/lipoamidase
MEAPIVVLTGAGVSAESGIPTFRGKEGYWTVGSREYHPQELATHAAFTQMPWDVWAWYLHRRAVCRAAAPDAAHRALATLNCDLITQNVDGLHRRAGSTRLYPIHGDIDHMRCAADCCLDIFAMPDDVTDPPAQLRCPRCRGMARPHVLWFDESYDEPRFFLDTARRLAARARTLIVAGTSAQTNLPWQIVTLALRAGATVIDINTEDNPFGELATRVVRAPAAEAIPAIVAGHSRSD